ncbi:hypothetical protein PL11_003075 [Lentilactobacillus curieae]|uniref:Bacterial Ig domain-containing protein n=1 Tax=Lentilactobacillus curieae TaxID=1138822 RepID=A0A1S6QH97_9LACO|nr:hypothetical protein [Lentilactobacillus curieae]AQW20969.1 hypothetical protein PL11_003075 [Lentilactobacillus curieae]
MNNHKVSTALVTTTLLFSAGLTTFAAAKKAKVSHYKVTENSRYFTGKATPKAKVKVSRYGITYAYGKAKANGTFKLKANDELTANWKYRVTVAKKGYKTTSKYVKAKAVSQKTNTVYVPQTDPATDIALQNSQKQISQLNDQVKSLNDQLTGLKGNNTESAKSTASDLQSRIDDLKYRIADLNSTNNDLQAKIAEYKPNVDAYTKYTNAQKAIKDARWDSIRVKNWLNIKEQLGTVKTRATAWAQLAQNLKGYNKIKKNHDQYINTYNTMKDQVASNSANITNLTNQQTNLSNQLAAINKELGVSN